MVGMNNARDMENPISQRQPMGKLDFELKEN
jgi:hypothetical protein